MTDVGSLDAAVAVLDDAGAQPNHDHARQVLWAAYPPGQRSTDAAGTPRPLSIVDQATAWAVAYLVRDAEVEGRRRAVVEPMMELAGQDPYPPPVAGVTDDIADTWQQLSTRVTTAPAKALLEHLLFARHHGNAGAHARCAAEAYLAAAARWDNNFDAQADLRLALRLARSVGASDVATRVVHALVLRAESDLDSVDPMPGVTLGCLEPLLHEPGAPDLAPLLRRSLEVFPEPAIRTEILRWLMGLTADATEEAELADARVQTWLDAADRNDGLLRMAHLRTAVEEARTLQRPQLLESDTRALQASAGADLGMEAISSSTSVPHGVIMGLLAPVVDQDDWRTSLYVLGRYMPVTGNAAENTAALAERGIGLLDLVTVEHLDAQGLPRMASTTAESRAELALARHESSFIQVYAPLVSHALHEVAVRHGVPAEDELTAFFASGHCVDPGLAAALGRVLTRFWIGDYEGATFTGAPRVQALARRLVTDLDLGAYRVQEGTQPGHHAGMAHLLTLLHGPLLDDTWYRMIYTTCCNPYGGTNLRNATAHGLVDGVAPPDAAILIQALLHLTFLDPQRPGHPVSAPSSDVLPPQR